MQLCNSGENAPSYIGVTSRTFIPAQPMSNFSFSVRHLFQFRFWPHRRSWHVVLRQHATFHQCRIYTAEIWRLIDFQDGGRFGAILLPYRTGWRHFLHKVNIYQHTNYRQDNWIHGRDITISVLQIQSSAVLKFFFRFRLWLHHRNLDDILHKFAKLHPYRTTQCRNMTLYRFSRCRTRPLNTTSGVVFVDITP